MSSPMRNAKKRISLKRSEVNQGGERRLPLASQEGVDEILSEELSVADVEEFREFMASGEDVPQADPVFKERLRRDLWWTMVSRLGQRGNHFFLPCWIPKIALKSENGTKSKN